MSWREAPHTFGPPSLSVRLCCSSQQLVGTQRHAALTEVTSMACLGQHKASCHTLSVPLGEVTLSGEVVPQPAGIWWDHPPKATLGYSDIVLDQGGWQGKYTRSSLSSFKQCESNAEVCYREPSASVVCGCGSKRSDPTPRKNPDPHGPTFGFR